MSSNLGEEVQRLLKELVHRILRINEDSELFKHVEKKATTHLRSADSLFFANEKEIDRIIDSLCKKFEFHGLAPQARTLQRLYEKLIPSALLKPDRINRLNIIKFLLGVSESPTNNVHKYSQRFERGDEEDIVDWPQYLWEGIPRWSPPTDEESSEVWSDESEAPSAIDDGDVVDSSGLYQSQVADMQANNEDCFLSYHNSKTSLVMNVQSKWFNCERVCFKPASCDSDANVALLWDKFVQEITKGLVPIQSSNVISEYKVMREVLWQLYEPHSSYCFMFVGNSLVPKENVAISSVRAKVLESFLYEFIPYIDWFQTLREFNDSLVSTDDTDSDKIPPETYKSYNHAVQTIIQPIFNALEMIEQKIRAQEATMTLLMLTHEVRPLFRTVKILYDVHCSAVLNYKENSSLHCATTLLGHLRCNLQLATSKLEQDLYLALYLHSLYKYFTIVNAWLGRDALEDRTGEFVIADENPKDSHVLFGCPPANASPAKLAEPGCRSRKTGRGEQDWQMEFMVMDLDDSAKADSLIGLLCTQVLQIGKNVHLLRLLGKLHLVPEFTGIYKETLYEAYIARILQKIAIYFNVEAEIDEAIDDCTTELALSSPSFVFPAACPDECKYLTEMDRLENLVDTKDGFLLKAFEAYFIKKEPSAKKKVDDCSLYERISKLTKNLFPVQEMLEHVFLEILGERFSISGLMVKNVLVEEFKLKKQFSFLKNVFLFGDDMIFPLYRRIFHQLDLNGIWGNHTWLTSHLHDIIMDAYPDFYKECSIEVADGWRICTDPLKACSMINMHYQVSWPVNIIIRDEHIAMYRSLFQFILKIKWTLYTLNHLYFTELEPKGKSVKHQHKSLRKVVMKLKTLRFGLINILSNIQHYILGHIFSKFSSKFDKALKEAYDLESLMQAHEDFIQQLHRACMVFQEYNSTTYGFYLLLYLVLKLRAMWQNMRNADDKELDKCERSYWLCHENIDPIINPTGYYSYVHED